MTDFHNLVLGAILDPPGGVPPSPADLRNLLLGAILEPLEVTPQAGVTASSDADSDPESAPSDSRNDAPSVTASGSADISTSDSRNEEVRAARDRHWIERFAAPETARRLAAARQTGEACGGCGALFAPGAPAWLLYGGAPACEECARLASPSGRYNAPAPCRGCERPLYQLWGTYYRSVCSDRCRQATYNRQRRAATAAQRPRSCTTCGQRFLPPRADGRYCSPACRQRAYRQRRGVA